MTDGAARRRAERAMPSYMPRDAADDWPLMHPFASA
jgi:hypothetical protein